MAAGSVAWPSDKGCLRICVRENKCIRTTFKKGNKVAEELLAHPAPVGCTR